jgi:hypothetical protein
VVVAVLTRWWYGHQAPMATGRLTPTQVPPSRTAPGTGSVGAAVAVTADEFHRAVRTNVPFLTELSDAELDELGSGVCKDIAAAENAGDNPASRALAGFTGLPLTGTQKAYVVGAAVGRFCPDQRSAIVDAANAAAASGAAAASPAGQPAGPPDAGARTACRSAVQLSTSTVEDWTEQDLTAIEDAATQSSVPAIADAGRALGRARAVWVRDKARFTSADDLMVVQADIFSAVSQFVSACAAAGATGA